MLSDEFFWRMKDRGMKKAYFLRFLFFLLKAMGLGVIVLAVFLNVARFVVTQIPDKNQFIAAIASGFLKEPVSIKKVHIEGSPIHPVVVLSDVKIGVQTLGKIQVGMNLWRSLWRWTWMTDHIVVNDLKLFSQSQSSAQSDHGRLMEWLMAQPDIIFQRVDFSWQAKKKYLPLQIQQLVVQLKNHGNQHLLAGHFVVPHRRPTEIHFILKAQAANFHDFNAHAMLYVSANHVYMPEWVATLPGTVLPKSLEVLKGHSDFKLWVKFEKGQWQSVQAILHLADAKWQYQNKLWSITPVDLNAIWYPHHDRVGVIAFKGHSMKLRVPLLFSHPVKDMSVNGSLQWHVSDRKRWEFKLTQLDLHDANLKVDAGLTLRKSNHQDASMSAKGCFSLSDLKALPKYLPDRILHATLRQWLVKALTQGQLMQGKFLLQGPLSAFPFDHKNGHFEVDAKLQNVSLHFLKGWPNLTQMNGRLKFDDRGMLVQAHHARLAHLPVQKIVARIDDLTHANLIVDAKTQTDLSNGVAFIKHSRLGIARDMDWLTGSGPVAAKVQLQIPFYDGHGPATVRGHVKFDNDVFGVPKWSLVLKDLTGELHFKDNTLSSDTLRARLLDQAFRLHVHTPVDSDGQQSLHVTADGRIHLLPLLSQFSPIMMPYIQGSPMVHVGIFLHNAASKESNTVSVISNLNDLVVEKVPAPIAKPKGQDFPMRLQLKMLAGGRLALSAFLGDKVTGQFALLHHQAGIQFVSGQIHLGKMPAVLPKKPGLFVSGILPSLNLSLWQAWVEKNFSRESDRMRRQALPSFLKHIDLSVDRLKMGELNWQNLLLEISPQKKGTRIQVQNANVSGNIFIPVEKNQAIRARMDYLFLSLKKSEKNKSKLVSLIDPTTLPPLDVKINDFRMQHALDGSVSLVTVPIKSGMVIKQLQLESPLFQLSAHGKWSVNKMHQHTLLTGKLDSPDFGKFLLRRHFSSRLKHGVLSTHFSLSWPGMPNQFSLSSAKGYLSVHLANGRILRLGTETESNLEFGRLLNLLSLESVSEFLTFNFSSITKKGFPFHSLVGELDIRNGNLFTKKMDVDGPIAHINIEGMIGLSHKKNDLMLTISPYVSSSLPVIVGLAGGPIAGVTAWVVNKILSPGVGHIISMRYHVTGSWKHPNVKKVAA